MTKGHTGFRHVYVLQLRKSGLCLREVAYYTGYSIKHVQRILTQAKVYKPVA